MSPVVSSRMLLNCPYTIINAPWFRFVKVNNQVTHLDNFTKKAMNVIILVIF